MSEKKELGLAYRAFWRFRYVMLQIIGPADVAGPNNPIEGLKREREERLARVRASRQGRDGTNR